MIQIIKIFDLLVILCFVSHFFACKWILIGYRKLLNDSDGWIYVSYNDDILQLDFWSFYTAAIYWIISTFTSVGFGDIKGYTDMEHIFQIILMMIGIAFYGHLIGTF